MYEHSIKVYSLYKQAAQIVKQIKEGSTVNVKELVNRKQRRRRAKALQALVVETLQRHSQIDFLLKRSKLLATETHLDPWLMRVLITELLWGSKTLKGDSKPVKAILAYQQVFKAHVSDLRDQFKKVPVKGLNMDGEPAQPSRNEPLIPQHTKQAAKAMALLLFYSLLMFTLPFGAFFSARNIMRDSFGVVGFANTVYSVIAAVVTIYLIIFAYAYQAFHEQEYDDQGNEIDPKGTKSDLNLKVD